MTITTAIANLFHTRKRRAMRDRIADYTMK